MDADSRRIPARTQRQALDWSLALASQGIEPFIDRSDDYAGGWGLVVNAGEYDAALATIRQYRIENSRWRWPRQVAPGGVLFDWGGAAWAALMCVFYFAEEKARLRHPGMMDSTLFSAGEWWRVFTAVWLHADIGHLAANCSLGLVLLGLVMGRYGTGAGLLAAYLGGVGGNLAGWALASPLEPHRSLGASGMVMAALGLAAAQSFDWWHRTSRRGRLVIGGVLAGLMIFLMVGTAPHTDVVAHAGGFLCGAALGVALIRIRRLAEISWFQIVAAALFALLTLTPWAALFLHGRR